MNGNDKRAHAWLKIAVLYFALAVAIGAAMGAIALFGFDVLAAADPSPAVSKAPTNTRKIKARSARAFMRMAFSLTLRRR